MQANQDTKQILPAEGSTDAANNTHNFTRLRRRRQGGMMLVTMLGLIACMIVLLSSAALLATNMIQGTRTRIDKTDSENIADAGIDLGLAWVKSQAYPPDTAQVEALNNFWGASKDAKGRGVFTAPFGKAGATLVVGIYPDTANPTATQKRYLIESRATMRNGVSTTVRAYAQQGSFGKYAYFMDSMLAGAQFDFRNHFGGPVHSNNTNGVRNKFVWSAAPPDNRPIFEHDGPGALETVLDPIWARQGGGDPEAPDTDAEWSKVAIGGKTTISSSPSNFIDFPETTYEQMYIALGLAVPTTITGPPTSLPTQFGVKLSDDGGIFIHGDTTATTNGIKMALSTTTPGVQKFTIVTKPSPTQELTQVVTAGPSSIAVTSVLRTNGTVTPTTLYDIPTKNIKPKGIVFSDSEIKSLSGTVADNQVDSTTGAITHRNQWSIFTDTRDGSTDGKDVLITDSIKYSTRRDSTKTQDEDTEYKQKAGTLGIVANDIAVSTKTVTPTGGTTPLTIDVDADLFCTGAWKAETTGGDAVTNPATHTVTNMGGIIVKEPKLMRSGSSGRVGQYAYDQRLADNPPPFFPTTGNKYSLTSYQVVTAELQ